MVMAIVLTSLVASAAEPLVLELPERVAVRSSMVSVADVIRLSGGNRGLRERIAQLDLAEFKSREESITITRRVVEYRLRLAGFDNRDFIISGSDRAIVTLSRRQITADEVVAAARAELLRRLAVPHDTITVELARPIAVKLPEVPIDESIMITAQPHGSLPAAGRAQMDVVISSQGNRLLALSVLFDVKQVSASADPNNAGLVMPTSGGSPNRIPPTTAAGPVLVRNQQRVTMQVRSGELVVTAVGEAQQEGRLGQSILVKNVDSKKMITARVSGPATVEVDLPTPTGGQ
jgi:hypothetical protein